MLIVTSLLFFNKDRRPTKVLSDNFFSNYGIRSANEKKIISESWCDVRSSKQIAQTRIKYVEPEEGQNRSGSG
jgi:hypothetical protein